MFYVFFSLVEYILAAKIQKYWIAKKCGNAERAEKNVFASFQPFRTFPQ